ncbi:MmgE/PrpD family protein [Raoultella planticola]|uniref:MmgE/PrpD family protein n=1 Tax=Raoultella planticola TaxID=575 RepID=A0ABU5MAK5_RAOPL|nr:MmgE/PrpD family protein [Raoultella planticola]MDW4557000.1 MmgE/PrpD family protein [Raoultella planticola]MDZ7448698.1 MmgE/PrpD family protein [Raoultella planticola]MDZ7469240.1 MmgE/PrpD family protein [Raoultella planticola]MDZ7509796.1 MmgE/PrpD family protein [Raoultella planticola]MEA5398070.1 MmgE/PrpD family protein [Raoultella planticola]
MSLTQALAALIVDTLPSADAREKARAGLLDFLAVTLPLTRGDIDDSGLKSLRQVYRANDAQSRALRLGYAGHALDFDDFHADFRGHPSTVILPALLALAAERADIDGDRFLDAYVIGVEAAGRLGLAAGPRHYTLGFHSTATLGTIAAAAACARFVGAGARDTAVILGIAATQASGLRAQFGSEAKPLHAGLAAQAAVSATLLALSGFHGQADKVLDAFLTACCAGAQQAEKLTAGWGAPWRIVHPGLEFKPWPTCGGTHGAADAARAIRQAWLQRGKNIAGLQQELERVEVSFPPGGDIAASVRQPTNGIEARFSLEYVIAASLLRETLLLADFSQGALDEEIAALAQTVARRPDLTAPPDELNPANRFHQVTIFLRTGETLQKRFTRQQSLAIPFDLAGKVDTCLSHATDTQREEVVALSRLESRDSLPRLTDLLFTER